MHVTLLHRMGARDKALLQRLLLRRSGRAAWRVGAVALTHLGGARVTIALSAWPLLLAGRWTALGRHALLTLILSHLFVQLSKRTVGRPRPSFCGDCECLVVVPDRFSLPSGHAAAALSVALAYATFWPGLSVPLLTLATLIGGSRVVLGVHYPGDVAAGQVLALVTHLLLLHAVV
ncbi:MAG: phosphatase PAP2 family protein [bacterium]